MLFFKKKKKDDAIEIKAYFEGTVLPLEKVNDPMFSDKLMGDGVAIEPDAGNLYAPVDGKVASIFDTKHAIGFVLDNGAEVLMHIGMDTVELNGEGFDLDISVGDEVHAGELMGSIDLDFVKSKGKETVTPIVLTAMDEYKIEFVKTEGHVNIGDVLYKISKQLYELKFKEEGLCESKVPFKLCRIATDIICVIISLIFGGNVGIGTVIIAFGTGPVVQFFNEHLSKPCLYHKRRGKYAARRTTQSVQ